MVVVGHLERPRRKSIQAHCQGQVGAPGGNARTRRGAGAESGLKRLVGVRRGVGRAAGTPGAIANAAHLAAEAADEGRRVGRIGGGRSAI